LAKLFPGHRWAKGILLHGLKASLPTHAFRSLRLLKSYKQEAPFRLLLNIKDIARLPAGQHDALL
jgi:hypothetical protein